MFKIFDDDNSGSIEFEEFVMALNATKSGVKIIHDDLYLRYSGWPHQTRNCNGYSMYLTGSAGVRTRNHFTLILTRDGGGTIDAQEIHEMVMGLFAMSGMEVTNDDTRPGVDKVKPKGWFKFSSQID